MRPRLRQLSSLWHRWGKKINLDAVHCAEALVSAGAIEMIDHTTYREVENTEVSEELYEELIMHILTDYKAMRDDCK